MHSEFTIFIFIVITRRAGSDGSMSASGSAGPGFDPRWGMYVEKAYITVDSDSSVGWGR